MAKKKMRKRVAISVGDLNGIGIELILRNHQRIKTFIEPIYCIGDEMLKRAADLLDINIPEFFNNIQVDAENFDILPATLYEKSGAYSFASFIQAVEMAVKDEVDAICTLPIHKKAWELAGIKYKGHTHALRDFFDQDAIMMLGCSTMYIGFYTEHIPLKLVPKSIDEDRLFNFFINFQKETRADKIGILGLNPHAGDNGLLGDEEKVITSAINRANREFDYEIFMGPLVPDVAFTPHIRNRFNYYIAMYHDQGLAPLKALYF